MIIALAAGIIPALLSIGLKYPGFQTSQIGAVLIALMISPGILIAIAIARNVHEMSVWIAAGINFIFYFLIVWGICAVVSKRISRKSRLNCRQGGG